MAYKRKTAREQLETNKEVQISHVEPRGNWKLHGKMVIPPALEYEKVMKKVPKGKLMLQEDMREYFAKKYKADFCCPLVTGIFTNIVAKAAEEDVADRGVKEKDMTPYWRTLKTKGELNPKYPGGLEEHAHKLRKEGFKIEKSRTGKLKRVKDYEKSLYKPR